MKPLILSTLAALLLLGCSGEQKQSEEPPVAEPKKSELEAATDKLAEATEHFASVVSKSAVEVAEKAAQSIEKATTKAIESTSEAVDTASKAVEEESEGLKKTIAPQHDARINGSKLFTAKCGACHGQNAEKSALNKSQIIAGWEIEKTEAALQGYKTGTYGGAMKALMKGQVGALTDDEIHALAKHISGL